MCMTLYVALQSFTIVSLRPAMHSCDLEVHDSGSESGPEPISVDSEDDSADLCARLRAFHESIGNFEGSIDIGNVTSADVSDSMFTEMFTRGLPLILLQVLSGETCGPVVGWSSGRVIEWSRGRVVKCSRGQVVGWKGDPVVKWSGGRVFEWSGWLVFGLGFSDGHVLEW